MFNPRSAFALILAGWLATSALAWSQQPFSLSPTPSDASVQPGAPGADDHPTPPGQSQETIKLQAEKFGIPRPLLFRQLQPQIYPKYEAKTKPITTSVKAMTEYLQSLEGSPPDLQRISAYDAELHLDWSALQGRIKPDEKGFRTYQLMQTVVVELDALTQYWITRDQVARPFRGTQEEADQDKVIMDAKMKRIQTALSELKKFEETKKAMEQEEPYR